DTESPSAARIAADSAPARVTMSAWWSARTMTLPPVSTYAVSMCASVTHLIAGPDVGAAADDRLHRLHQGGRVDARAQAQCVGTGDRTRHRQQVGRVV